MFVKQKPFTCFVFKPWAICNDKLGFCFLKHCNHPHPSMTFLKEIIFSWVIFATLNCSCVNVTRCLINWIFFTCSISATSYSFCNTHVFPLFYDYVISYMWLQKDVIGTPHHQIQVCKLLFFNAFHCQLQGNVIPIPIFFMFFYMTSVIVWQNHHHL